MKIDRDELALKIFLEYRTSSAYGTIPDKQLAGWSFTAANAFIDEQKIRNSEASQ